MEGRHVLVTGGTGGLGGAVIAAVLARRGVVTATYRGEPGRRRLEAIAPQATGVTADLGDERAVERAVDSMPRLDVLIHLVGGFVIGPTHTFELEAWRRHQELTLTTTFLCCKHALRRMREAGYGRIVTVGSRAAVEP